MFIPTNNIVFEYEEASKTLPVEGEIVFECESSRKIRIIFPTSALEETVALLREVFSSHPKKTHVTTESPEPVLKALYSSDCKGKTALKKINKGR